MAVQPKAKRSSKDGKVKNVATQAVRGLGDTLLEAAAQYMIYEGGNGKTSVAFVDGSGVLHKVMLPHARMRVSGHRVDRKFGSGAVNVRYADFLGDRWGYGDQIWDLATDTPVDVFVNSPERYGTNEHVFYALLLAAEAGLPSGSTIELVVTVPPGLHDTVSERVAETFKQGMVKSDGRKQFVDGWWEITLTGDKEPRQYRFAEVHVLMEGVVAYSAYRFSLGGQVVEIPGKDGQDALGGRCRIIDLGFGTADTPTLIDGNVVADSIGRTTDAQGGILVQMAEPIMNAVLDIVPNAALTPQHVDRWLREWAMGKTTPTGTQAPAWSCEAADVLLGGQVLHLYDTFEHYAKAYANYVYQRHVVEALRQNIDVLLCVGGGWLYIYAKIKSALEKTARGSLVMLSPETVDHLRKENVGYIDLNTVGALKTVIASIRYNLEGLE